MHPGTRGATRLLCATAALWGLFALMGGMPVRTAEVYPESSVKAAFLLRFGGYVEWQQRPQPGSNFVIAVLGADDVAAQLQKLAAGRRILELPVQVRRISSLAQAGDAHVLYLGSERAASLRESMRSFSGRDVLVVTDDERGIPDGSAINFRMAGNRVRFEISLAAARRAQLQISSDLLAVAARVTE
jgi:hypothetical protein